MILLRSVDDCYPSGIRLRQARESEREHIGRAMRKGGRPCGDMPGNEDATLGTVCREESIVKARTEHIHNNLGLNYMHLIWDSITCILVS
jgi:hypothetical protein